jgi:signal transduction histidine kinase/CheY-like chemotaxis protein
MSVRTRISILLLIITAIFAGTLFTVRQRQAEFFREVAAAREKDWHTTVKAFLLRQEKPSEATVQELAADRPIAEALANNEAAPVDGTFPYRDKVPLSGTLDDRALKARGLHAVWLYRADGTLLHAHALPTAAQALDRQPLPGVDVRALVARSPNPHFFFDLPGSAADGAARVFVEVRGAPVLESVTATNATPRVVGYFFAGCLFGQQEVAEMPLLRAEDHIELTSPLDTPSKETPETMTHPAMLRDWADRAIGQLVITNDSRELTNLQASRETWFWIIVSAAVVGFIILFTSLSHSIVQPLKLMGKGLDERNVASLASLAREKSEFGELARLIQDYFEQSTALAIEFQKRVQTQDALRTSDEMLRHSQKMEAVGRLAGGVAHDFNNLLTAIIGYAALLRARLAHDAAGSEQAELIHQAGEQAAGLTRQLLAFSRKQLLQPRLIDLNAIVRNLQRLLQRIIGEHIEIQTAAESTGGCVLADPGQIEQVIVNLGVNARDAMPRGGRLLIRTVDAELNGASPEVDLTAGAYIAIEVTDTGEGMDAETKARIFEPFFTTKGPGKGTGLGLATVYGIVRQSGGAIAVDSERGRGTTFRIYLPRQEGVPESMESAPAHAPKRAGTETVLVVEDEEIVRELVCEVLRGEGYRVAGTDRGSEALRLVREELKVVDLLISDVVMPEMNGAVVARRVRELSPQARVLFVSGYSESDMLDQGLEALSFQVMQKPFTPTALARKVREVLDGAEAPQAVSG